jgi:oligopeptide/dipeptide ABC transporter ATP-binding protein
LRVSFAVKQGLLRRTVGHVRALDGVDLRVLAAQTHAIVGEPGCGKTTLARALLRGVPANGKVLFGGKDLLTLTKAELRTVQRELVLVTADSLWTPDPLSALSAVTAQKPKLLVLDEPFAGLSDGLRLQLFDHLRRQQEQQGLTCLLLTRDVRLGCALAEEVVVLFAGQVVETGASASLSREPQHPHTESLLAARTPAQTPSQPPLFFKPEDRADSQPGCRFREQCPKAFERCAQQDPALFAVPGGLSRCFLRDPLGT